MKLTDFAVIVAWNRMGFANTRNIFLCTDAKAAADRIESLKMMNPEYSEAAVYPVKSAPSELRKLAGLKIKSCPEDTKTSDFDGELLVF